jgi:NAD(P)-dependent dehydrogenase (short-subunit alcohol dehydrogenase family)
MSVDNPIAAKYNWQAADVYVPRQHGPAVVLGARHGSGNIGEAIAVELAGRGWYVHGDTCLRGSIERPKGAAQMHGDTAAEHGYEPGTYAYYSPPSVHEFVQWDADILVVALGKTAKTHFAEVSEHEFLNVLRGSLELPLLAARRFVQAVDPIHWAERRELNRIRRIIFIGSYAHSHPFTNGTAYCAAKAGLNMAARTLGWELTGMDYRIHIVHPYHVPGTPMWQEVERGVMEAKGWTKEQADEYAAKDLRMPHLTPQDVARTVALLCTGDWDYTSGTPIELYGGSR